MLDEIKELYLELRDSPYPNRWETGEFSDPTARIAMLLLILEELSSQEKPPT